MRTSCLLLIALLIASCQPVSPVAEDPIDHALSTWESFVRDSAPDFDRAAMTLVSTRTIDAMPRGTVTPGSPLEEVTQRAFASSVAPDGTQTLVLLAGDEPDSEVLLIAQNGEAQRVLFCGTPCRWTHVAWVDDHRFVVAGLEEAFTETGESPCAEGASLCVQPVYYLFDLMEENVVRFSGVPKALEEMPVL